MVELIFKEKEESTIEFEEEHCVALLKYILSMNYILFYDVAPTPCKTHHPLDEYMYTKTQLHRIYIRAQVGKYPSYASMYQVRKLVQKLFCWDLPLWRQRCGASGFLSVTQ